jgi:hypothetical protein
MKLRIDFDKMTVEEAETLEEYTDLSLEDYQKLLNEHQKAGTQPRIKYMTPLIWISGRQDDPNFSMDDARKISLTDIEANDDSPQPNPTEAAPAEAKTDKQGKGKKGKASTDS